jgi:hypothetical protein
MASFVEIAREELGSELSDVDVQYVMWEYTGFPLFFETEDIESEFRDQLRRWKADPLPAPATEGAQG